jgi:hypothetical protein
MASIIVGIVYYPANCSWADMELEDYQVSKKPLREFSSWANVVRDDDNNTADDGWTHVSKKGSKKLVDKDLVCRTCNDAFVFTVVSQKYYADMGYDDPKCCRLCSEQKKKDQKDQKNSKTLICKSCNDPFYFTTRQQEEFKQKGWKEPKVCKNCKKC